MNYLLIKNGFVVKESSVEVEDILVGRDKIIQLGKDLERPSLDTPIIDASGKYVMPGAIDINRHYLELVDEGDVKDELKKLNQAQIFNGTTTMIDGVQDCYGKNHIYNIFKAKEKSIHNLIDYGFHLTFKELQKCSPDILNYSYIHEGVSTFLLSPVVLANVEHKKLENIIKCASGNHLLVICDMNFHEGEKDEEDMENLNQYYLKKHFHLLSVLVDAGIKYNCPLLFLNIKYHEEIVLIQEGIERGGDLYASLQVRFTLGNFHQVNRYKGEMQVEGDRVQGLNPLSESELWFLVKQSRFLINAPLLNLTFMDNPEEELVYNRPDAYFYIRNYMSMLYSIGVMRRNISVLQLVDLVSKRPAQLMGLWPKKGVIKPGADADIVIWNPVFERNLYCLMSDVKDEEHKNIKLKGRADFVFVKGRMVYNGESFYPKPYDGAFVFRTSMNV